MNILETTVLSVAGIEDVHQIEPTVATRSPIFEMTQMAEDTVIRPKDCGSFSHKFRAWLAARIAEQAGDAQLALHYMETAGITENSYQPKHESVTNFEILIAFVDKAANSTRDIESQDIVNLQGAGFADSDIVKLCQLLAFVAYQVRVVAGLRMMNEIAP